MNVTVAVSLNITEPLTYKWNCTEPPYEGMRVIVPLGRRVVPGWITGTESSYKGRVKPVAGYIDDSWRPSAAYIEFIKSAAELCMVSPGSLLDYSLSPGRKSITSVRFDLDGKKKKISDLTPGELIKKSAGAGIRFYYNKPEDVEGKTEENCGAGFSHRAVLDYESVSVCSEIVDRDRASGRNTLIVVPDSYTGIWLKDKLGKGDLYVSSLKVKERSGIWQKFVQGESGVLIGGLSALMLPSENTGSVIFFRTGSYQYHGSSFTDYNLYELARRKALASGAEFIECGVVNRIVSAASEERTLDDKRETREIRTSVNMIKPGATELPPVIKEILRTSFLKGERAAVIMNKKQSSGYLYCKSCKTSRKCNSCGGNVTVISKPYGLSVKCSGCGYSEDKVSMCNCGKELIHVDKPGINSVLDMVKREITDREVAVFTADEIKKSEWQKESKIFLGTPALLTPEYRDFFDTVIVLRPENYVDLESYDGAELLRAFICEMGEIVRAGGVVEVFSVFHFHYSLQMLDNEERFLERELDYRRMFRLPPFFNVYELEMRSKNLRDLGAGMRRIAALSSDLAVKKIRLKSRTSNRGYYRAVAELHTKAETIIKFGIIREKDVFVKLLFS